jgi:hypothetical protein
METPDENSHDSTTIEYTMPPKITTTGLVRRSPSSKWRAMESVFDRETGN